MPWYFKFYLQSCSLNSSIDFLFITDYVGNENLPTNFNIVNYTLQQISELIDGKLQIKSDIRNPFKLCDFRPAFGIIFSDYLHKYDFWGHSDIDIIYGNIRTFITEDKLANNDIIAVRKEYITGFFSIYRNSQNVNRLYLNSKDYLRVFQSSDHYCFDECGGSYFELMNGKSIFETKSKIESITHVASRAHNENKIRSLFLMCCIEDLPGNIEVDNGRIYFTKSAKTSVNQIDWNNGSLPNERKEFILYHLIKFKKLKYLNKAKWNEIPQRYFIGKTMIYKLPLDSFLGLLKQSIDSFSLWYKIEKEFLLKWAKAKMNNTKHDVFIKEGRYKEEDNDDNRTVALKWHKQALLCQIYQPNSPTIISKCYFLAANKFISLKMGIELEILDNNSFILYDKSVINKLWNPKFIFEE